MERFLKFKEVSHLTGLSRSTIWRAERRGDFPRRIQVTMGTVRWKESEVQKWLTSKGNEQTSCNQYTTQQMAE